MSKNKKSTKKKADQEKKETAPRRSVMRLSINGSLDDVLRQTFIPPPKKD